MWQSAYEKQRAINNALASKRSDPTDESDDVIVNRLTQELGANAPSLAMQNFAAVVPQKLVSNEDRVGSLWRTRGHHLIFRLEKIRQSNANDDSLSSSPRRKRLWRFARDFCVQTCCLDRSDVFFVLGTIARKFECSILKDDDEPITGEHCVVLRDHMGGSTNALLRLQQGVKTYRPSCKFSHLSWQNL